MKSPNFNIIRGLISATLLTFVVYKIGPIKILQTFKSISLSYLPLVLALYGTTLILGGIRLWILLRPVNKGIPTTRVLLYSMLSWAVGLFTPGNVGEFSLVHLLSKEGVEIGKAIGVLLIDKAIILSTLVTFSGLGMFILFDVRYILYLPPVLAVSVILIYFSMYYAKRIKSERFSQGLKDLRSSLKDFVQRHKALLFTNFILTIVKWCITGVAFFVVFVSLGSPSNVFLIIIISMTIIMINIIPVTLHGLGLKEVAAVYFYVLIGIPEDVAVVTSLFFSLLAYTVGITLILAFGNYFHKN